MMSPLISPRGNPVSVPTADTTMMSCKCKCRGNSWGNLELNPTARVVAALSLLPRGSGLSIDVPYTMMDMTKDFTGPMQEDLWSPLVMLGFGIAVLITIFVATYFWYVGVLGSRRLTACKLVYVDDYLIVEYSGDGTQQDVKMQQWKKVGGGGGGGGGKRHSGDGGNGGDDDPDGDKLSELLKRLLRQDDRRTPEQKKGDEDRRMNTQCIFIGWFDEDKDMKATTGLKRRYRRCRENMSAERKPWCHSHYLKENDDPDRDPSPPGQSKKGGHGSGNSTGVPHPPAAVLGGKHK